MAASQQQIFTNTGNVFADIVDTITKEIASGGITYTYICYASVGTGENEEKWAIQRSYETTDANGNTVTYSQWARESGSAGRGAYFRYKASSPQDAFGS